MIKKLLLFLFAFLFIFSGIDVAAAPEQLYCDVGHYCESIHINFTNSAVSLEEREVIDSYTFMGPSGLPADITLLPTSPTFEYSAYILTSRNGYKLYNGALFEPDLKYEIIYKFKTDNSKIEFVDLSGIEFSSDNFVLVGNDGTDDLDFKDAFSYYNIGIIEEKDANNNYIYKLVLNFIPKLSLEKVTLAVGGFSPNNKSTFPVFINKSENTANLRYETFSMNIVDEFSIEENSSSETTNKDIFDSIKDQTEVSKGIWGTIKDMFSKIGDILSSLTEGFINIVKKVGEIATDIIGAIIDLGANLLKGIGTLLADIVLAIGGFFETLGEWIADGIIAIGEFFTNLGKFIIDGLKFLFIPQDGFLDIYIGAMDQFLTDKLGILYFPISFSLDFLNRFINMTTVINPIITIPPISIGFFGTLIQGTTWDISAIWNTAPYAQIYSIYLLFVKFFVGYCLYRLALKKYSEFFGGDSR